MVLIEYIINNVKRKVYGRPGQLAPHVLFYCVIEEEEFSHTGDCILFQSPVQVNVDDRLYTEQEANSLLPLWLIQDRIRVTPSLLPIKYITFFLPTRLKENLNTRRIENQAGLTFTE